MSPLSHKPAVLALFVCLAGWFTELPAWGQPQTFTESIMNGFPCAPTCQAGSLPAGSLIQTSDGSFYGTANGGPHAFGTVIKITPPGKVTALYSFCSLGGARCSDGFAPMAGVVQASDGNFYGTTSAGGDNNANNCNGGAVSGCGTVFKMTPSGALTTLHSFCHLGGVTCADGFYLATGLVEGSDGNLYGATLFGGTGGGLCNTIGCGTLFRITPSGTFTTFYSFCSQSSDPTKCPDGANPAAALTLGSDGNFYGTASSGGAYGNGVAFKITPAGILTVLHDFCPGNSATCPDGDFPSAVIEGIDGNFYGTTYQGGAGQNGTAFKLTPSGTLTTFYSFCITQNPSCATGANPTGLIQGSDGNFYGVTYHGGANSQAGTAFQLTPGGTLTTLYKFCSQGGSNCTDGSFPNGLIQGVDGDLYGTTQTGGSANTNTCYTADGSNNCGTVFKLTASPPEPILVPGTAANGATYIAGGLVPGSWAQVKGTNLSDTTRIWGASDFEGLGNNLPTTLSGVLVLVNGLAAPLYYISPGQLSFQVPSGISGNVFVQVINGGVATSRIATSLAINSPAIFPVIENGINYPAGVFLDGDYVGDPSVSPAFRNAKPGDVIQLYATGLVPTASGIQPTLQLVNGVSVTIGGATVPADFAGLVAAGEFQINFTVPQAFANQPAGLYPISIQINGVPSPATINSSPPRQLLIPIQP